MKISDRESLLKSFLRILDGTIVLNEAPPTLRPFLLSSNFNRRVWTLDSPSEYSSKTLHFPSL